MNTKIFKKIFLGAIAISGLAYAGSQTDVPNMLQIMKDNAVIYQIPLADLDSIVLVNQPIEVPAPSINATIESAPQLRAGVQVNNVNYIDGELFFWEDGDQMLALFNDKSIVYEASGSNGKLTTFTTEGTITPGIHNVVALYPSLFPGTLNLTSINQNAQTATHLSSLMVKRATAEYDTESGTLDLGFKHLTSLVRFALWNNSGNADLEVTKITLSADNAGGFVTVATLATLAGDVFNTSTTSNKIELNVSNGTFATAEGKDKVFYGFMPLIPTALTDVTEMTVTVEFNNGSTFEEVMPMSELTFLSNGFEKGKSYYFQFEINDGNIVVAVPPCLDLTQALTMGNERYNTETQTITYTGNWQNTGWDWGNTTGIDVSQYDYLKVIFDTGGTIGTGDGDNVEICVSYVGGNGDGDYIINVPRKVGNQTVIIPLGVNNRGGSANDKSQLWRIGTKNGGSAGELKGTVVLESVCFVKGNPYLDGDYLNLDEQKVMALEGNGSYDPATKEITYSRAWDDLMGWRFGGVDFSAYDYVTIEFETAGAPPIEFFVQYPNGRSHGDYQVNPINIGGDKYMATVPLGECNTNQSPYHPENGSYNGLTPSAANVQAIGLKRGAAGTVTLTSLKFGKYIDIPAGCMDVNNLNFFSNGGVIKYDMTNQTIVSTGDWQHAGWEWATPQDFSAFTKVVFDFDASGLPLDGGGPQGSKVQLIVTYEGGGFDGDEQIEVRSNVTGGEVTLGVKGDKTKVKKIALKTEKPGTVKLNSVCLE